MAEIDRHESHTFGGPHSRERCAGGLQDSGALADPVELGR
jgi:hypothetical protein